MITIDIDDLFMTSVIYTWKLYMVTVHALRVSVCVCVCVYRYWSLEFCLIRLP